MHFQQLSFSQDNPPCSLSPLVFTHVHSQQLSFSLGPVRLNAGYKPPTQSGQPPPPPSIHATFGLGAVRASVACFYEGLPPPFPPLHSLSHKPGAQHACLLVFHTLLGALLRVVCMCARAGIRLRSSVFCQALSSLASLVPLFVKLCQPAPPSLNWCIAACCVFVCKRLFAQ